MSDVPRTQTRGRHKSPKRNSNGRDISSQSEIMTCGQKDAFEPEIGLWPWPRGQPCPSPPLRGTAGRAPLPSFEKSRTELALSIEGAACWGGGAGAVPSLLREGLGGGPGHSDLSVSCCPREVTGNHVKGMPDRLQSA